MKKDIDNPDFWAERIQRAKEANVIHYSVFLANPSHWNKILRSHLRVIEKLIKPDESVLDAGCGYGRMSVLFQNYVGVDFSTAFIREAKTMFPDKQFVVGDLRKLPFDDKQFDWGIAISIKNMVIGNMGEREWKKMENELKRVCKKTLLLEYGDEESNKDTEDNLAKYEIL